MTSPAKNYSRAVGEVAERLREVDFSDAEDAMNTKRPKGWVAAPRRRQEAARGRDGHREVVAEPVPRRRRNENQASRMALCPRMVLRLSTCRLVASWGSPYSWQGESRPLQRALLFWFTILTAIVAFKLSGAAPMVAGVGRARQADRCRGLAARPYCARFKSIERSPAKPAYMAWSAILLGKASASIGVRAAQ